MHTSLVHFVNSSTLSSLSTYLFARFRNVCKRSNYVPHSFQGHLQYRPASNMYGINSGYFKHPHRSNAVSVYCVALIRKFLSFTFHCTFSVVLNGL